MTPQDQQRQELIKELSGPRRYHIDWIVDWVIADRKRIVAPLKVVGDKDDTADYVSDTELWEAIDQTLKNAGCDL